MKINFLYSMLITLFLAMVLSANSPLASINIQKDQILDDLPVLARIRYSDLPQLDQLASTLDIWEVHHDSGYVIAYLTPAEYQELISRDFQLSIDQELTNLIDQQRQLLPGQSSGIPGFPCYRTVEETYIDLANLAAAHPELASWIDIGDSWEKSTFGAGNGYDIHTLVLSNSNVPGPKPRFYLMAAIHAREYATAEMAARFAEYLVRNYDKDADITWLLDYFEVHITPITNPDGRRIAEQGVYWRKNTNHTDGCPNSSMWGTDLNRNSSFKWGGVNASANSCDETYRGSSAASESETQTIQDYVRMIFADRRGPADTDPAELDAEGVFITLHSYGDWIFYPWSWTAVSAPNDQALQTLARKFGFFTDYQVCQAGEPGCLYQTSGNTDDWAYGELGIPSYTFELGTTYFESCSSFEEQILPDQIPALLYAFKAVRLPYQNPSGPEVVNLTLSASRIAPGAGFSFSFTADDTRYNSSGWGQEPSQPIAAARYSLETPSWVGGTQTSPLQPSDGVFDSPQETFSTSINTNNLAPGRHIIFVESQDAAGNWGVPSAIFFWITPEAYQPDLTPDMIYGRSSTGSTLVYKFQITNLGTQDDTFDIELTGNNWPALLSHSLIGPLIPGESAQLSVETTIPKTADIGTQDLIILVANSRGDAGQFTHAQITTSTQPPRIFFPNITK